MALQRRWTDEQVEQVIGRLLQIGVTLAALVVLIGAIRYLAEAAAQPVEYHVFHGEPKPLRTVWAIGSEAAELHSRGLMQLGLVLLIRTPVARVLFTVFAFFRQRD